MNKKTWILFGLIILLAGILRFFQLGSNPPGLNLDEVAIGWNAESILKTGRDEYGKFMPLAFRSHDDYKPPLYIYMTVPSEAIFGMNSVGVRFPSALLGVGAVIMVFFLAKELFPKNPGYWLGSSLLLAISPWHLQFTRVAFETGSTAFFTAAGLLLFLAGLRKKNIFLMSLAGLVFGLEIYLYQAAKVFVPLFLAFLFIYFYREAWKFKKLFISLAIIFTILFLPTAYLSTTVAGQMRLTGTSIMQEPAPHQQTVDWRVADWLRRDRISATLFHPVNLSYSSEILSGYLSHFRPDFLLVGKNGPPVNYIPNVGLMHLWEFPLLLIGLFVLWKDHRRAAAIITVWMLLAPVPASVTSGVPSSIRAAEILPSLQLAEAVGLGLITAWLAGYPRKLYLSGLLVICIIFIYSLGYCLHMEMVHGPLDLSETWFYGYDKVVTETAKLAIGDNKVIVSTGLRQPQNFYAFYLNYDPQTYITMDGGTVSGGFNETRNHFSKYYFQRIPEKLVQNIIYVGFPEEFKTAVTPLETFYYLNGKKSVIIVRGP